MKRTMISLLFFAVSNIFAQIYPEDIPRQSDKFSQEQNIFIKELQIAYSDWMAEQNYFWRLSPPPSFGTGARSWAEVDRADQLRRDYERQRQLVEMKQSRCKNLLELYKIKFLTSKTIESSQEPVNKINKQKKKHSKAIVK